MSEYEVSVIAETEALEALEAAETEDLVILRLRIHDRIGHRDSVVLRAWVIR